MNCFHESTAAADCGMGVEQSVRKDSQRRRAPYFAPETVSNTYRVSEWERGLKDISSHDFCALLLRSVEQICQIRKRYFYSTFCKI